MWTYNALEMLKFTQQTVGWNKMTIHNIQLELVYKVHARATTVNLPTIIQHTNMAFEQNQPVSNKLWHTDWKQIRYRLLGTVESTIF